MNDLEMTPRRPYLFRAMYDWIVDNGLTPYIVVNTLKSGVLVPMEFVQKNQIVLNIAPHSVGNYFINNERIEFSARFAGKPETVIIPFSAVEAIYAKENAVGLGFEDEPQYEQEPTPKEPKKSNPFSVVK